MSKKLDNKRLDNDQIFIKYYYRSKIRKEKKSCLYRTHTVKKKLFYFIDANF